MSGALGIAMHAASALLLALETLGGQVRAAHPRHTLLAKLLKDKSRTRTVAGTVKATNVQSVIWPVEGQHFEAHVLPWAETQLEAERYFREVALRLQQEQLGSPGKRARRGL